MDSNKILKEFNVIKEVELVLKKNPFSPNSLIFAFPEVFPSL
jgi:hypothetical protein